MEIIFDALARVLGLISSNLMIILIPIAITLIALVLLMRKRIKQRHLMQTLLSSTQRTTPGKPIASPASQPLRGFRTPPAYAGGNAPFTQLFPSRMFIPLRRMFRSWARFARRGHRRARRGRRRRCIY